MFQIIAAIFEGIEKMVSRPVEPPHRPLLGWCGNLSIHTAPNRANAPTIPLFQCANNFGFSSDIFSKNWLTLVL